MNRSVVQIRIAAVQDRLAELMGVFGVNEASAEHARLMLATDASGFWGGAGVKGVIARIEELNRLLKPVEKLTASMGDVLAAAALAAEDASAEGELADHLDALEAAMAAFELRALLAGPHDAGAAYVRIQAGAGGTEACDWAGMLLRMYKLWAERHELEFELVDDQPNEAAGIRSAAVRVAGAFAYGNLQSEAGVHRLVRISPYDPQKRRHTSFAAVDVLPDIDGTVEVNIRPEDLRCDTFRSGGPGGQHQNMTDSGVRYTHLPTGIAAESRSEKSQKQNRENAMRLLKARLYAVAEAEKRAEIDSLRLYDKRGEVSFGHQIRNYVLQPYTLVKDSRTGCSDPATDKVLAGHLDAFILAFLRHKLRAR